MKVHTLRTRHGWIYRCSECDWEHLHATRAAGDKGWYEHRREHEEKR